LVAKGKFDKYSPRELPKNLEVMKAAFSDDNVKRLLAGQEPEGVDSEVAAKLVKIIKRKAPVALNMANELIDAQSKVSIKEAVELELQKLHEIFATEDALAGLSTPPGTPVEFKGK
jgi:enoyl-CoA hydratase/3-hydroxyacyl-CoA dehydrogenase